MKLKIGIDDCTRCPVIGSLVIAMTIVKPDFFRKFASLGIKDSKLLSRKQRDRIVSMTKKNVEHFHIYKIRPEDMEQNNLNDLEAKAIIECLNTYPEFWKHEIYIDNFDRTKEKFIERAQQFLPHGLKNKKLDMEKWTIIHECDKRHKACSLASIFAKHFSDLEYDDLKRVYGDFGSGSPADIKTRQFVLSNPDCPHLRKSWKTYKDIVSTGIADYKELQDARRQQKIQSEAEVK